MKKQRIKAIWWPFPAIFFSCIGIMYALSLFTKNGAEAATLVVAFQALIILRENLQGLIEYASNLISLKKFFVLFDAFVSHSHKSEHKNETLQRKEKHSIDFNNVCFSYAGSDSEQLQNISLKISAGEKIAIVGANGSGKSTLVKLLMGFYRVDTGTIQIDNIPLESINVASIRKNIATVFQNYGEYHTSPAENILFKENTSEEELKKVTELLELIELDVSPNQKLGKEFDGTELSGGMWQKIAVARALGKNTGLYILDEFSSALDPVIEKKLFNIIYNRASTILVITHRLQSIKMFDKIVVLDDGKIVEEGTYAELMDQEGLFFEMWHSQN